MSESPAKKSVCLNCGNPPLGWSNLCLACMVGGDVPSAHLIRKAAEAERKTCCQDVCIYCATEAIEEARKDCYSGLWRHNVAPCGPGEPDNRFKPCAAAAIRERAAEETE